MTAQEAFWNSWFPYAVMGIGLLGSGIIIGVIAFFVTLRKKPTE